VASEPVSDTALGLPKKPVSAAPQVLDFPFPGFEAAFARKFMIMGSPQTH
jgi:hypothetical protein